MKNIILFDTHVLRQQLLPLAFTRPTSLFRCGIFTLGEKWAKRGFQISFLTEKYLSKKFSTTYSDENIYVRGNVIYNDDLFKLIDSLKLNQAVVNEKNELIVYKTIEKLSYNFEVSPNDAIPFRSLEIEHVWDIFKFNGNQIRSDFAFITKRSTSEEITDKHTVCYNSKEIFVEKGTNIKAAILNAEDGPIYIGKNAVIQEGSLIKGPFALCEGSYVNMGAKMRGDNTIGPFSKVGGEISNSVIFGYSNKAHDGFIGNSVIGEWCNLGADTNSSNLKNDYSNVKIWSYVKNGFVNSNEQFCGLIMGDHSKCGINTMFNTGTVVGVNANIFGSGFPRNFIPSYAWGGAAGFTTYLTKKAFEVAEKVMKRRNIELDIIEKEILEDIFNLTKTNRYWEK